MTTKTKKVDYYVYGLVDPRDGVVFYVGKGRGKRARQHMYEARGAIQTSPKAVRIKDVLDSGHAVEVKYFAKDLTESAAFALERKTIQENLPQLTNLHMGQISDVERLLIVTKDWIARFHWSRRIWIASYRYRYGKWPDALARKTYLFMRSALLAHLKQLEDEMNHGKGAKEACRQAG